MNEEFVFYDDLWSFDGSRWSPIGASGGRSGLRVVFHPGRERLIAFGGLAPDGSCFGDLREWVDGAWRTLDPALDQPAAEAGLAYDARRGRLVLFGGAAGLGVRRGTTWEWDGAGWEPFEAPGPAPRATHGMVYDARRGRVVLFGGGG